MVVFGLWSPELAPPFRWCEGFEGRLQQEAIDAAEPIVWRGSQVERGDFPCEWNQRLQVFLTPPNASPPFFSSVVPGGLGFSPHHFWLVQRFAIQHFP